MSLSINNDDWLVNESVPLRDYEEAAVDEIVGNSSATSRELAHMILELCGEIRRLNGEEA